MIRFTQSTSTTCNQFTGIPGAVNEASVRPGVAARDLFGAEDDHSQKVDSGAIDEVEVLMR
jgi:hypothetical protein